MKNYFSCKNRQYINNENAQFGKDRWLYGLDGKLQLTKFQIKPILFIISKIMVPKNLKIKLELTEIAKCIFEFCFWLH